MRRAAEVDESAKRPIPVGEQAGKDEAATDGHDDHRRGGEVRKRLVHVARVKVEYRAEHRGAGNHDDSGGDRGGNARQMHLASHLRTQQADDDAAHECREVARGAQR